MRIHPTRRSRRILTFAALAVLFAPALLFGHAKLVRSDPVADAVLTSAPTQIRLWFSEAPDIRFSRIDLAAKGGPIELGALSAISSNGLSVPLATPLKPGTYVIYWRTAASDGHATSGRVRFTIGTNSSLTAAATASSAPAPPPPARPDTTARKKPQSNAVVTPSAPVNASGALRWAEFVALLTVIGAIIFRLVILPTAKWPEELVNDASDRVRRLAVAVAILFVIATFTRALAQSQLLSQTYPSRLAAMTALVTTTRWGLGWSIGGVGAIVVLIGFLAARAGLTGWIIAGVGVVAVTMSEGLTGHSGASRHLSLAMAMDVAHQLGAGGWIGGLACVLLAGLPATRRLEERDSRFAGVQLVRSYHHSALECVALVIASGVVATALRLDAVSDLWTTAYGSMLFRKLIFVLGVLGFGYLHWRRVVIPEWDADTRFRFARSAAIELVAAAVVVAFTALLVSTQLPR